MVARAKRIYILVIKANKLFSSLSSRCFIIKNWKTCSPCFYQVIETLAKVWKNSKKVWKHSPAARVPTAFLVLPNFHWCYYLTNRFRVDVRLFSNRSQMKCGKNKKVAHEGIAECVTDVLTVLWRLLWSITEQTHGHMESQYLFYIITEQATRDKAFVYF